MAEKISVLIEEPEIDKKIREVADKISEDYVGKSVLPSAEIRYISASRLTMIGLVEV